ncbi:MAG: hypothetical protein COB98_07370 [Flavobacteriaceae bacterium]|nr:MAG: hypothetical protein COB98_07370 [Flavobacteriaceae bacterium]
MNKLPIQCPSCESPLVVSKLSCNQCDTEIAGNFTLPVLLQLPVEDQSFIFEFILSSGSLKKMALKMKKSYPTVRNKLDDIIEHINSLKIT